MAGTRNHFGRCRNLWRSRRPVKRCLQSATGRSLSGARLPPFSAVLKSREVEDPINLWFNRPLAYGFVALVYRTAITPNQVTLMAICAGLGASLCWFWGTPHGMLFGGILLWASAILDGADGILARAKQSFSELGRALDGSADLVVAALVVAGAVYHLWQRHHSLVILVAALPVVVLTTLQIPLYDYYKESFLMRTRPDWDGTPERVADVAARVARLEAEGAPWVHRRATRLYLDLVSGQRSLVARLDPCGGRDRLQFQVSDVTVNDYRRFNLGPMRIWTALSLAPHTYLFAIFGMMDRIDLYLWGRLCLGGSLFFVGLAWQRRASRRTLEALQLAGLSPVAVSGGPLEEGSGDVASG